MYHFTADHPPEPVRLSFRALIPGHIRQYLKDFQIDAIRFMHTYLAKGEFCVYNDESGLGKQAAVAVLLDAACNSKKCLIVVQNDDRYVNGWEFHFNVLTNLNIMVVKDANGKRVCYLIVIKFIPKSIILMGLEPTYMCISNKLIFSKKLLYYFFRFHRYTSQYIHSKMEYFKDY